MQATITGRFGWEAEAGATAALLLGSAAAASWLDDHDMTGTLLADATMAGAGRG